MVLLPPLPDTDPASPTEHQMVFVSAFQNLPILGSEDLREGWTVGYQFLRPTRQVTRFGFRLIQVFEFNAHDSYGGFLSQEPANGAFGVGAMMLWRLEQSGGMERGLYFEMGMGLHWANRPTWDLDARLSFTPSASIGYFFPSQNRTLDLGVRLYHISNAGTNLPNQGQNQLQVRLGVRF